MLPRQALRRVAHLLVGAALALGIVPSTPMPAAAWNYNTHIWIVEQAGAVLAAHDEADWFDVDAAMAITNWPDSGNVPAIYHVYRDTGHFGGAVQKVTEHFAEARRLYLAHDYVGASKQIGLLAHYLTDATQPYHVHDGGVGNSRHGNYEVMIDAELAVNDHTDDWVDHGHTPGLINDVRKLTIAAATTGRAAYPAVDAAVISSPNAMNNTLRNLTKPLLRLDVNDLVDIIYSIERGAGTPPELATLTSDVRWRYPAKNYPYQAVAVTARDTAGKPIEGLEVVFTLPLPYGKTTTESRFTDPSGVATWYGAVSNSPFGKKQTVSIRAATNGHAAKTTTDWWTTLPELADGLAGFSSKVDNRSPIAGQYVTVTTTLRDSAGRAVAGVPVDWTWTDGSRTVVTTGVSNSKGLATSRYLVLTSTTFDRVTVAAHAEAGSHNRHSSAWFQRKAGDTTTAYKGWFVDIWGSKFRDSIVWLAESGITGGCDTELFCPNGAVTRGQMASFLVRALDLPATSQDFFTDDETSKHEANINRLAASGITSGCGTNRFCPDGIVTRGQMASFLVRALGLAVTSRDYFTDDETSKHEANINRLAASGITSGCSPTTFCPNGVVTRGQMAAFLRRALDD